MDLTIEFDESLPPHYLVVKAGADGTGVTVTLSRRIEAAALLPLRPEVAEAIVSAVETAPDVL